MYQYLMLYKKTIVCSYTCVLILLVTCHSLTLSHDKDLPLYDVNASCDFVGIASHFQVRRGFYYGSNQLVHINCHRDSATDLKSIFNKNTWGLGYRYLSSKSFILGVYGLCCVNSNFLLKNQQENLYVNKLFSTAIFGLEYFMNRYHAVINVYIPIKTEYNLHDFKEFKMWDLADGSSGVDFRITVLSSGNSRLPSVSVGIYLIERAYDQRLIPGFLSNLDYQLSSHFTFTAKLTADLQEKKRWTVGLRYHNYNSSTYASYRSSIKTSKLLYIPIQHSVFSYAAMAPISRNTI